MCWYVIINFSFSLLIPLLQISMNAVMKLIIVILMLLAQIQKAAFLVIVILDMTEMESLALVPFNSLFRSLFFQVDLLLLLQILMSAMGYIHVMLMPHVVTQKALTHVLVTKVSVVMAPLVLVHISLSSILFLFDFILLFLLITLQILMSALLAITTAMKMPLVRTLWACLLALVIMVSVVLELLAQVPFFFSFPYFCFSLVLTLW